MRLIDADAFDKVLEDAQIQCRRNGGNFRFGVLSTVRANLENAPTVATDINVLGKWISVKDRLPEAAGYECLVCAVNENYNQTHVFTAHTGYGEPGWWTSNVEYMSRAKSPTDNSLHPALKVTHWMPLPEPPEED